MRQKIALFLYEEPSLWASCEKINANLIEAARLAYPDHNVKTFFVDSDHFGCLKGINSVKSFDPDVLYFIDHRLSPMLALSPLKNAGLDLSTKKIKLHLFGNFIFRLGQLDRLFKFLEGTDVQYNFSCQRMASNFSSILPPEFKQAIYTTPLPVEKKYLYKGKARDSKLYKILYTGRISPEKNVHLLMETVTHLRTKGHNVELTIVGAFDDLNDFKDSVSGSYMAWFSEQLNTLDPEGLFIKVVPFKEELDLISLLSSSDMFVTLSTMSSEDYGMSLAEAAVNGLDCVATNWGGHLEIASRAKNVQLVETKYENDRVVINSDELLSTIEKLMSREKSESARKRSALEAFESLGPQSIAEVIKRQTQFLPQPLPMNQRGRLLKKIASASQTIGSAFYENAHSSLWR